ncbi:MAG: succinylglutamate desuccinylase/aspartoacylase family protein, partial [bacterium]
MEALPPRPAPSLIPQPFTFMGTTVPPGAEATVSFPIAEFYTLTPAAIPVTIINGLKPGPVCFITAAIHGDELNGVETVRRMIFERDW